MTYGRGLVGGAVSVQGDFVGVGEEAHLALQTEGEVIQEDFVELDDGPAREAKGVVARFAGAPSRKP